MDNALLEKLTIAIPVYNDDKYIGSTVESCLGQAAKILIYDNASTDGTGEICTELAARHPSVRYIRHPENIGAFENFKKSLFDCETEYFCWIGSHDLIDAGYSLPLLEALEKNENISLGAGTIVYIDEDDKKTGQVTKTLWATETNGKPSLDRAGICATKIKDCFLFYSIHRTKMAQAAWIGQPCLGFDRAFLCRVAAQGEISYQPQSVFFARDFIKSRKVEDTNARRIKVIGKSGETSISKDLFYRNKAMVQTLLDLADNDEKLGSALAYIEKINRRYVSRRKYQKKRLIYILIIAVPLLSLLASLAGRCLL